MSSDSILFSLLLFCSFLFLNNKFNFCVLFLPLFPPLSWIEFESNVTSLKVSRSPSPSLVDLSRSIKVQVEFEFHIVVDKRSRIAQSDDGGSWSWVGEEKRKIESCDMIFFTIPKRWEMSTNRQKVNERIVRRKQNKKAKTISWNIV